MTNTIKSRARNLKRGFFRARSSMKPISTCFQTHAAYILLQCTSFYAYFKTIHIYLKLVFTTNPIHRFQILET